MKVTPNYYIIILIQNLTQTNIPKQMNCIIIYHKTTVRVLFIYLFSVSRIFSFFIF